MKQARPITLAKPAGAPEPIRVSVIITTQRRPAPLRLAVASVLAQTDVDVAGLELVVVDNDARPSALDAIRALACEAPFAVRYVHEPRSGVSNARNAGVAAAAGPLIAFLDDDEEAPPAWLGALLRAQAQFHADVVFAPVRARLPASVARHRQYLERFFSRVGPAQACVIEGYHGCGDSLIRRAALPDPAHPFNPRSNRSGGEDDMLFRTMKYAGARFCWAPDAWVWEDPSPERLNLGYTLRRAFVFGQGTTHYCAKGTPPNALGAAGWMAVGLAQVGLFGLAAVFQWLTGAPDRAFTLDRAARGLGKLLWGGPFRIDLYGQSPPREARAGAN
ncbi:MAG: glycosyltransferase family 2 protein [Caulobacterales bacterium]